MTFHWCGHNLLEGGNLSVLRNSTRQGLLDAGVRFPGMWPHVPLPSGESALWPPALRSRSCGSRSMPSPGVVLEKHQT